MVDAARGGDEIAFRELVAPFQRELRAHCYRMSGSLHDADDLLQESMLRAWKGLAGFEGRSSVRTWLYKVATSACLDALDRRGPRLLPMDLGPAATDPSAPIPVPADPSWLEPFPGPMDDVATPEARYGARESVALAFLTALQLLPAKQRAVLLLRDVLGWQATECAELLELSVPAVNSALQRARDTLATRELPPTSSTPDDEGIASLLARYVHAWEQADVSVLVSLLREDATLAMPPMAAWFHGASVIGASIGGMVLTPDAKGRFRLVAISANGAPAFAAYERDPKTGQFLAAAVHVLDVRGGKIAGIMAFLEPSLFPRFGLAPALAA